MYDLGSYRKLGSENRILMQSPDSEGAKRGDRTAWIDTAT
jgi:hypothetical protein